MSALQQGALACNMYISEGRDADTVKLILKACENTPHVVLGHVFVDESYNRTGITLLGRSIPAVVRAVLNVAKTALSLIDLSSHSATHPRLGVVDHVVCHPLEPPIVSLHAASKAALEIARGLAYDTAYPVPSYVYGHASRILGAEKSLASIRRQFGYFKSNTESASWVGSAVHQNSVLLYKPDFGEALVKPEYGIACVGSTLWVVNHNVLLDTENVDVAKAIAKLVSERGGGLAGVQAMGLATEGGVEVACNLLDQSTSSPADVDELVTKLAHKYRVKIIKSYQTGKNVKDLLDQISNQ